MRDLCFQLHDVHKRNDVAKLTTEMYLSNMEPVLRPADAFAALARGNTERVPIDELEGRVATSLLTPYPPGIPLLIPGERFNRIIVTYLGFAREFNHSFPGFEADIHGLVIEEDGSGFKNYFVDCIKD